MKIRFGSVCSGIEAASVAWNPLGWEAAWFSEIEPFPCEVLKKHYPNVPNRGDMTSLPERIMSGEVEAPDMLCGGTPCQAFSVAGKRQSLDDHRGNLSLTFCEVADAIDHIRTIHGKRAAVVFWENVPGVLSTKDNAFGCFLGELAGANAPLKTDTGRWPCSGYVVGPKRKIAWRVLDAQHFGVPQRRRRVFVVASARDDIDPTKILFEQNGVRGDSPESGSKGKNTSTFAESSFGTFRQDDVVSTVRASGVCLSGGSENLVISRKIYENHAQDGRYGEKDVAPTVVSRYGTGGNNVPLVLSHPNGAAAIAYEDGKTGTLISAKRRNAMLSDNPHSGINNANISPTLDTTIPTASKSQGGLAIISKQNISFKGCVRRLTPIECERLQGFKDNYTRIPYRGKNMEDCPDGPRYKAIGNSWAVPCVRWIGKRIGKVLEEQK